MASQPLGGASAAVIYPDRFPPAAATRIAFKLLNRHSSLEIADAIEILMDVLDLMGGDPDAEDDDPAEAAGDEADTSWSEWNQRGRRKVTSSGHEMAGERGLGECEDDEDDDPAGQRDEDGVNTGTGEAWSHGLSLHGPGCPISDPGEWPVNTDNLPVG